MGLAIIRSVSTARLLALCLITLLCAGCVTPPANLTGTTLQYISPAGGYRASTVVNNRPQDDMLVVLSFSGGGMRASAMAYGVLEQLANDGWTDLEQRRTRVLDSVDVISAVSGGAVPAAYYVLHGDRLFEDFADRYLYRDVGAALTKRFFYSPVNWWRLIDKDVTRADIFAEFFDSRLFKGAHYADLDPSGGRPFLIVNATDIGVASRFEFTQDEFDRLCLDLQRWPISRAVAASSAVPALITPITLTNHAGQCNYRLPPWIETVAAETDHSDRLHHLAASRLLRADPERYGYLHLVDGALSDNLGVGAILDALLNPDVDQRLNRVPKKLVIIMVNAGDSQAERIGGSANPPGFLEMLRLMGTVPVDRHTAESRAVLREQLTNRMRSIDSSELYFIEVELSSLRDHPEWDPLVRLPTSFSLQRGEIDALRQAAARLLAEAPDYRRWLQNMTSTPPAVVTR